MLSPGVVVLLSLPTLWDMYNLAGTRLQDQARYGDALVEYRASLALLRATGRHDFAYAMVVNNLAAAQARLGMFPEAEAAYREALDTWKSNGGLKPQDEARVMANLGSLYFQQGRNGQATESLRRAIELQEKDKDPLLFNTLTILANVQLGASAYADAEKSLVRARSLFAGWQGTDPSKPASTELALCWLYTARAQLDEAQEACGRAERIIVPALGRESSLYGTLLIRYARIHMAQGEGVRAERETREALGLIEKTMGPDHPMAARALVDLALLARDRKQGAAATPYLERSLRIFEKADAKKGSEYAGTMLILADQYRQQGRLADAEALCAKALRQMEENHGANSLLLATPLNNMATILYSGGAKPAEVEPLLTRALRLRETFQGPSHPDLADVLLNLGVVRKDQGLLEESAKCLQRSLALRQQAVGGAHPSLLPALSAYVGVLRQMGRKNEAKAWTQLARSIQENRDPADPRTHVVSMTELLSLRDTRR
jgi:tetratricopeptide (TPR) repeat protein